MTTNEQNTELLKDFQNYLEQSHSNEPFSAVEQPDLNTLLSELTTLKTEVKTESRHFKSTLDTLSSALDAVQDDNKTLTAELAKSDERIASQETEIMRSMLLEMVELYDKLNTGIGVLQSHRPVNRLFQHSQKKDIRFIEQFKQGQIMTIKRFERLLQDHHIKVVECIGQRLDPATMSAVETGNNPKIDNGIVLEELRKGFLYQNQVLRLAEVKVNKTKVG